jgi:ribosomal protein S21
MVVITKKKGETKDAIFRKFTKLYIEDEIAKQLKDRQYYKKPSQVNKEKKKLYASRKRRRRS